MKTSEFIRKVESLGYTADVNDYEIFVEIPCFDALVACVSINTTNVINTKWTAFIESPESERAELFTALAEYVSTPIEQRAEEKVYQLRHKWVRDSFPHYLNKESCGFSISSGLERLDKHTKATAKQWEEWTGRTWEQLLQEFDEIELR